MYVRRDKVKSYIARRPQSFSPNRWDGPLRIKKKKKNFKKKKKLWLRTFYSVTIKVIELVLIKQDT